LQESIAVSVNVHLSDVEITIDDGVATYSISSLTADDAFALQEALQERSTNAEIVAAISNTIPTITNVLANFF
jgi:hypothetical protein